jgi:hypothetical protein
MQHIPFRQLLVTLIFLGTLSFGYSQNIETEDVVYLKDGSVLKGQIHTYEQGQSLRLHLHNGQELTLLDSEIEKIVQKEKRKLIRRDPLAAGKIYHSFSFSGNVGSNLFDDTDWGIGIEHVTGYWLTSKVGVGIGGGIVQYSSDFSWRVAPLYLDVKLKSPGKSPFYVGMDAGIGFPLKNDNVNIIGSEVGERIRFGLGKIWTLGSATNISAEFSYLHQRASFESRTWNWWSEDLLTRNILFKRYQLRFGFLF